MKIEKIQTGLRIAKGRYDEIAVLADKTGISFNAMALALIEIGLQAVTLGVQQAVHSGLHTLPHNGEQCTPSSY